MATAQDLYLDLMMRSLTDWLYDEFVEPVRAEGLDWPARAHTMIGLKRLANVRICIESVLADSIPGDLIETGAWRGGTTIFMRAVLKVHGVTDRTVWVADSFAGLPPPDANRYPRDQGDRLHTFPQLAVPLDRVRDNFRRYGLLDEQVRFLEGWFRDTLPGAPNRAARGSAARRRPVRVDDPGARVPLRPAVGRGLCDRRRLWQRGRVPAGGARLPRRPRHQRSNPTD
jgi:Macrocin-O-methyltransferase (TylF)